MPKFFVKNNQVNNTKITIIGDDVNHIKNVLRLEIDDDINICNVDTKENYTCGITKIDSKSIECTIFNTIESQTEGNILIDIFQGIPKADKMELIIQKSVELGANSIIPVEMKRCVSKIDEKTKSKKISRWQKISEVAAKQCGRDIIPKINDVIKIENICKMIGKYDIVLLAYENEEINSLKKELHDLKKLNNSNNDNLKIGIIIGPEGGFEKGEVDILQKNGAKVITLGKRILRTETVAFTMLSIIMYELGDLGGTF